MLNNAFLQTLVQINLIPVLITVFLLFFIKINFKFEQNLAKQMTPCVAFLLCLIVIDNMENYAFGAGVPEFWHRFYAMLGYDVRIFLMVGLINIAYERQVSNKILLKVTYIPALLNAVLILPCLFTDIVFYYKDTGEIGRGPLAYIPHIISMIYIFFLFYLAINSIRLDRKAEAALLFLCAAMTVLAVLIELLFQVYGVLVGVIALDITFYYLYLHIEHFRFDNLTKVFNRESFYADVKQYGDEKITQVLSIDLNNLKVTNDTQGHAAGDMLIKNVANIMRLELDDACYLYRVGGDEFVVLCLLRSNDEVKRMADRMSKKVEEAGYSIAIGLATVTSDTGFDDAYKKADANMYENKIRMKS